MIKVDTEIKPIRIGKKLIRPGHPAYLIFEVASTHENNWEIAKEYVKQAKEAGADALKFQLFTADELLNPISTYLTQTYNYFKTAETPREWFPKLVELCNNAQIDLLCTPFDEDSASYLDSIGIPAVKIASGDLTHHRLLKHVAQFNKPVILSTGMASMDETQAAVNVLTNYGCNQIILLQCTSVYPMPYEAANIKAMNTLQSTFRKIVGYSDNGSRGIMIPLLALAKGASVIEKHVTSQKSRGNMDDVFSLSVEDFAIMEQRIRQMEKEYKNNLDKALEDLKEEFGESIEKALGSAEKKPAEFGFVKPDGSLMLDEDEKYWARRGVYFKRSIPRGTKITEDMLILNRPAVGIQATECDKVIGAVTAEDIPAKHPLKLQSGHVFLFQKKDIPNTYTTHGDEHFRDTLLKTALFK